MALLTRTSVVDMRRYLHSHPELSGEESSTAAYVRDMLRDIGGFDITESLGGHGVVATKRYGPGPTVAYRAELDALPVQEQNDVNYRSKDPHVSHACGHDGHMAMLFSLVQKLEDANTSKGTLMLLFQSAEETGEGAAAMLEDLRGTKLAPEKPAMCFALHNIPGRPLGEVLIRNEHFACASVGVRLVLHGRTAHAAHPEQAINPLVVAGKLLQYAENLASLPGIKDFALCTPIALQSGEATYGTSPEAGTLMFTLRARRDSDLRTMNDALKMEAQALCNAIGMQLTYSEHEYFPAVINAKFAEKAEAAAKANELQTKILQEPFRWSEDFAHFADWCPIFIMGLGSGEDQPALHAPDFDFPDDLLHIGGSLYHTLYDGIQKDD